MAPLSAAADIVFSLKKNTTSAVADWAAVGYLCAQKMKTIENDISRQARFFFKDYRK